MKLKLNNLKITNFKGIDYFELTSAGENVTISGENGTGKTSVADAFFWLLTDQNLERRSKFGIIKNGAENAEVEAEIWVGSKSLTIKKTHRPIIKNDIVTRFTTDYYVDDLEVSQNEYRKELDFDHNLRLFSDVHYFMPLSVGERRKLLLDLTGKINDSDIIKEYDYLKPVKKLIGKRDFDRVKRSIKAELDQTKKILEEIPIEIRTLKQTIPNIELNNRKKIEGEIEKLSQQIADKKHGGDIIKQTAELEAKLTGIKAAVKKEFEEKHEILINSKMGFKNESVSSERILYKEKLELEDMEKKLVWFKNEKTRLIGEWKHERSKKYKKSNKCYACGQKLPKDRILKQEDNFNKQKAKNIKELDIKGKNVNKSIKDLETAVPNKGIEIKNLEIDLNALKKKITEIDGKIESLNDDIDKETAKRSKQIRDEIKDLKIYHNTTDETYRLEKQKIKLESNLAMMDQVEKIQDAIKKIEKEKKKKAAQIEKLEKNMWLLDEFNRKRVEFIEANVNDKFEIIEWKLFELLLNQNIKDICNPYNNGVPYSDLNTGAKINIGLDIINAFSAHYDIWTPIFIDNSESITDFIETSSQMINLSAKKGVKDLTIE